MMTNTDPRLSNNPLVSRCVVRGTSESPNISKHSRRGGGRGGSEEDTSAHHSNNNDSSHRGEDRRQRQRSVSVNALSQKQQSSRRLLGGAGRQASSRHVQQQAQTSCQSNSLAARRQARQAEREQQETEREQQEASDKIQAAILEHALQRSHLRVASATSDLLTGSSSHHSQIASSHGTGSHHSSSSGRRRRQCCLPPSNTATTASILALASDDDDDQSFFDDNSGNAFFEDNSGNDSNDGFTIATWITTDTDAKLDDHNGNNQTMRKSPSHGSILGSNLAALATTSTANNGVGEGRPKSKGRDDSSKANLSSSSKGLPRRCQSTSKVSSIQKSTGLPCRNKNKSFDERRSNSNHSYKTKSPSPYLLRKARHCSSSTNRPTLYTKGAQLSTTKLGLLKLGRDVSIPGLEDINNSNHSLRTESTAATSSATTASTSTTTSPCTSSAAANTTSDTTTTTNQNQAKIASTQVSMSLSSAILQLGKDVHLPGLDFSNHSQPQT